MTGSGKMGATRPASRGLVAHGLAFLVRLYQLFIRPLLPPACRFHPSCSAYAIEALQTHGAVRGLWLASWRVLRCNPFVPGGYDPVPPAQPRACCQKSKAR